MIVVVADTSPLNYLVQIDCEHLLPALFEKVLIPAAVWTELDHAGAPRVVKEFLRSAPAWLAVREAHAAPDLAQVGLHPGESEAIQLALDEHADLLLMDEKRGVRMARQLGLEVTGTLGVLVRAGRRGLIDIDSAWSVWNPQTFAAHRRY